MKRLLYALAATTLVTLSMLWFLSASALAERDPQTLLVFANNASEGQQNAYRVMAFDSAKKARVFELEGLFLEKDGASSIAVDEVMTQTVFKAKHLRGTLLGHRIDVSIDESRELSTALELTPWHSIIMRGPREPLLIASEGQPSAHFENNIWRPSSEGYERVPLKRGAQHVETDDGRWLKLSYNAMKAKGPLFTQDVFDVELNLKEKSYVLVELVADSKVVAFKEYDLMHEGVHQLSFQLDAVPAKTQMVSARFFRSPFAREPSARVHALFRGSKPTADEIKKSLASLGGSDLLDDPLLRSLTTFDERVLSSVFSRLFYSQTHAPNVAQTREQQLQWAKQERDARSWRYRVPFRALCVGVCIALCLVAFVFAQKVAGPYRSRRGLLAGALALLIGLVIFFVLDYALTLMGTRVV